MIWRNIAFTSNRGRADCECIACHQVDSLIPPITLTPHLTGVRVTEGVTRGMSRILVVDDHEMVRRGVRALLESHHGWIVCGEAFDGLQAIEQAKSLRPDLIVMDVSMPNMNGLDATRIIVREIPGSRILLISQNDPGIIMRQMADANAHGFVAKSELGKDLICAVERILSDDQATTERAV